MESECCNEATKNERQLIKSIPISTKGFSQMVCSSEMRCFNFEKCEQCYESKKRHIEFQVQISKGLFNLSWFTTITLKKPAPTFIEALSQAMVLRSKLLKRLSKTGTKYIAVVDATSGRRGHVHLLWSCEFQAARIKRRLADFKIIIKVKPVWDAVRLTGYLLDQNYKKALKYKVPYSHVLTASKPFRYGKPLLKNIEQFLLEIEAIRERG